MLSLLFDCYHHLFVVQGKTVLVWLCCIFLLVGMRKLGFLSDQKPSASCEKRQLQK
ncbi:unnamed protein product, partial [Musa textilis]